MAIQLEWEEFLDNDGDPSGPGERAFSIQEGSIMVAEFRGPAPHDLGVAELATARFLNENIEMSLHVVDDWHRPTAQLVRVQITPAAARSLLDQLTGAVAAAVSK
jgi:hypothetical protein